MKKLKKQDFCKYFYIVWIIFLMIIIILFLSMIIDSTRSQPIILKSQFVDYAEKGYINQWIEYSSINSRTGSINVSIFTRFYNNSELNVSYWIYEGNYKKISDFNYILCDNLPDPYDISFYQDLKKCSEVKIVYPNINPFNDFEYHISDTMLYSNNVLGINFVIKPVKNYNFFNTRKTFFMQTSLAKKNNVSISWWKSIILPLSAEVNNQNYNIINYDKTKKSYTYEGVLDDQIALEFPYTFPHKEIITMPIITGIIASIFFLIINFLFNKFPPYKKNSIVCPKCKCPY